MRERRFAYCQQIHDVLHGIRLPAHPRGQHGGVPGRLAAAGALAAASLGRAGLGTVQLSVQLGRQPGGQHSLRLQCGGAAGGVADRRRRGSTIWACCKRRTHSSRRVPGQAAAPARLIDPLPSKLRTARGGVQCPCERRTLWLRPRPRWRCPTSRAAQNKVTVQFVPQSDLALLDPVFNTALVTRNHGFLVFDQLYGLDDNLQPQPQMVEGHVIEDDGRTWKMTLRDGMTFHDGTPVLARDAIASITRWAKNDPFGQNVMAVTDELSAPSDRVIQFRLKKPFPLLSTALAKPPSYLPGDAGAAGADAGQPAGDGDGGQRPVPLHRRGADGRLAGRVREVRRLRAASRAARPPSPPGRSWSMSTGWSGTPSPTPAPPRPRCSAARWIGGSSRRRTCCRCCARRPGIGRGEGAWRAHEHDPLQPPAAAVRQPGDPPRLLPRHQAVRLHDRGDGRRPQPVERPLRLLPARRPVLDRGRARGDGRRAQLSTRSRRNLQAAGYKGERVVFVVPTDLPVAERVQRDRRRHVPPGGDQPRLPGVRLGFGGAAAEQQGGSGQGRLERLVQQHPRHHRGHARPPNPTCAASAGRARSAGRSRRG